MPKPTDGVKPSVVPQQAPSLEQKEARKAKEQALRQKISRSDQARIAQQAGFSRAARKKSKGLDIGDSSRAPIPLPDDDVDNESWSSERLDTAQKSLGLATAQFEEIAEGEEAADIGEAVIGGSFFPTEQGVAQLEDLAQRSIPASPTTSEMTANIERLFAIKLDEEVPIGQKLLAAGLVAAGESGWVSVDKGRLSAKKLATGIQKVTERSNQAVGEAQKNIKGIDRELNVQRTFVYKR